MKDTTHPTDKPKGQMSIREAASMELPEQHLGMERRGTTVHGFGDGQTEPPMQANMGQSGVGEAVMELIERMTLLPFHAQLSVLRMMAPRILGVMDGRDREIFLNDLRRELTSMMMDEQDIQGT
ncbi:hypothetical protein [Archangium sp.]|uniref:hypothetical protein n=1 Tax=Archangium sp. TaxID=1872627 RepID=UPI00286BFEEB|nr:hypothetical protein [Archangium sp.]